MKFDKDLAAIHAYLCGDGYVIRNPDTQKHKYYYIGLRNTNPVLLKDFQQKFQEVFGVKPRIMEGRSVLQNKMIYQFLTKEYSYYSYEWSFPELSIENSKAWLRAFFDCEGWVESQKGKSRLIGLECCNNQGIQSIKDALYKLRIPSQLTKKKGRIIWRLTICGKENIKSFQKEIGFLHPEKKQKLQEAISSYVNYDWKIPEEKQELLAFVRRRGKTSISRNEFRLMSIKRQNLQKIQKALKEYNLHSTLLGPWKSNTCSQYYCLRIKEESIHGKTSQTSGRSSARITADL